MLFRRLPRIEGLAAGTVLLVPVDLGTAAAARPFLSLSLEPLVAPVLLDELEIGLRGPVMRPLVVHECVQLVARVVGAITAEIQALIFRAVPEFAALYVLVDIIAQAAVAVGRTARTAEQAAGPIR